jgi:tetraacyldisaccharide 4'-kinase
MRAGSPVAVSGLKSGSIVDRGGRRRPVDAPGMPVAAFSALARNDQFARTLALAGYDVRTFTGFRDHHRFTASDLRAINEKARGLPLLTTEKDLVRLPADLPFRVEALAVEVEWLDGWESLSALIKTTIGKKAN